VINLLDKYVALSVLFALIAGITFGLKGCGATSTTRPPGPAVRDLTDLVHTSMLIIVGQIVDIQPGRSVSQQETRLQFNDVQTHLERLLKGVASGVVVVEQLDTVGRPVSSEIGPPYRKGERYVLFLGQGEGYRYIAKPQGRFLLKESRVYPTEPGPVAEQVRGTEEIKFIQQIESVIHGEKISVCPHKELARKVEHIS